jgi:hypothetical protein
MGYRYWIRVHGRSFVHVQKPTNFDGAANARLPDARWHLQRSGCLMSLYIVPIALRVYHRLSTHSIVASGYAEEAL